MKTAYLAAVVMLLLIAFVLVWKFWYLPYTYSKINTYEECAKKFPILLSYPAQCNTPNGKHFVKPL
ncbi:MAG TPA: hypothetical protein VMQ44_03990 [Candidatus Saccharimonadales bacterium]|nr:hypothetical protein [Candidatus Saccharimonadales bacterium]